MKTTIGDDEFLESRFADVKDYPFKEGPESQIPLAKVTSVEKRSRAWRVTLARIDRQDGNAPNLRPLFRVQDYNYTAGGSFGGAVPPRRDNPVFGLINPGNNSDIEPLFVQIAWGMTNGKVCRLIAHWPMMGASIVVEGSFVEVFGGGAAFLFGVPPVTQPTFPKLAAHITPADGLASSDAGELSITQNVLVNAPEGVTGLLVDGVANPTAGFVVQALLPGANGAISTSVVFNTAPFFGWDALITSVNPFGSPRLVISTGGVGPGLFELRDNEIPDSSGVFSPSPGDVGIQYTTNLAGVGAKTVAQLEALIATSTLIQVGTPGTRPADLMVGWTNVALYTPAAGGDEPSDGVGVMVAKTAGGAVYVPDFARRVKIELAFTDPTFAGTERRVPLDGPLPAQIVWYADDGSVVYTEFQGKIPSDTTGVNEGPTEPNAWRPVPAEAVMLAVYTLGAVPNAHAYFHWRIAP